MSYNYTYQLIERFNAKGHVESDGRVTRTYGRTYLYKADATDWLTETNIFSDIGIYPGSPYQHDPFATALEGEITHGVGMTKPPHFACHVKFQWSTHAPLPAANNTDPVSMRTIWTLRPTIQSRYIVKDRFNKMIVNTAGQPFDGGIPVDVRLGTAIARKNRPGAGYDMNAVLAHSGKLNSTPFLGAAAKTVQVDIEAEEKYEGGYHFWAETYTFAYDPLGWQPKPMNAGFYERSLVSANKLRRIVDGDLSDDADDPTAKVQEPEPLDDTGHIVPIAGRPDACIFVTVDYYETLNFNTFNL